MNNKNDKYMVTTELLPNHGSFQFYDHVSAKYICIVTIHNHYKFIYYSYVLFIDTIMIQLSIRTSEWIIYIIYQSTKQYFDDVNNN